MGAFRQLGEDGVWGGGERGGGHDGAHGGAHDGVRDGDLDGHMQARDDDRRARGGEQGRRCGGRILPRHGVDHGRHGELRGVCCELEVQLHVRVEYVENDWVDKLEKKIKKINTHFSEDRYGLG